VALFEGNYFFIEKRREKMKKGIIISAFLIISFIGLGDDTEVKKEQASKAGISTILNEKLKIEEAEKEEIIEEEIIEEEIIEEEIIAEESTSQSALQEKRPVKELKVIEEVKEELKKVYTQEDILEILKKGTEEWNKFRTDNPDLDLKKFNLKNQNFIGKDFSNANFSEMDFSGSDFIQAKLVGVDFTNSNLQGCNFFKADMRDSIFFKADIRKAGLKKTILVNADFNNAMVSKIWLDAFKKKKVKNYVNIIWR
jgi:hypothetical protein